MSTITPTPQETACEKFQRLLLAWKADTRFESSMTKKLMHPAYQQIIGMGESVLEILIAELRTKPDYWFWALRAITGEDPVPDCDRGSLTKMTAAWLKWADAKGL